VSKAINDVFISDQEFTDIQAEKTRYIELREQIRLNARKNIAKISEQEKQKYIEQGKKEEREKLAKNLMSSSKSA